MAKLLMAKPIIAIVRKITVIPRDTHAERLGYMCIDTNSGTKASQLLATTSICSTVPGEY